MANDLMDVPAKPILDLWKALIDADVTVKFPPLGPEHVRAIAIALHEFRNASASADRPSSAVNDDAGDA